MPSRFDIIYQCDSRPDIGNGHLKRGIDVLHALFRRDSGLRLALYGDFADSARRFIDEFLDEQIPVIHAGDPEPQGEIVVLDSMHRPGEPGYFDPAETKRVAGLGKSFVIISSSLHVKLPVVCDLFIDHLPDVEIMGEAPRVVHVGFKYAPVSNEFCTCEFGNVDERSNHLVAVLGGHANQVGPRRLAEVVYEPALEAFAGFTILLSPHFRAEDRQQLEQDFPWLDLMQRIPSLAPLLHSAEAVICTYGNITYESLACGKPTYLVNYARFQDEYATYLEHKGLVSNLGTFDKMDSTKLAAMFRASRRTELATRAKVNLTTSGIETIADELLELLDDV